MRLLLSGFLFVFLSVTALPAEQGRGNLDQQLSELARQIGDAVIENHKSKIAVLEFGDLNGTVTDLGRFLSEELITRLFHTRKFEVIERHLLNKIIAEQKLRLSPIADPESAKRLLSVLGADAIVSGSISDLGQSIRVNARLINSGTGKIFAVASAEITKDDQVKRLFNAVVSQLPPEADSVIQETAANDFTFRLSYCRVSGGALNCLLQVINDSSGSRDLEIENSSYLGRNTEAFDEAGNQYLASSIELGTRSGRGGPSTRLRLAPQVATNMRIRFDGVNSEVSSLRMLRISCAATKAGREGMGGRRGFSITFKNIQIAN